MGTTTQLSETPDYGRYKMELCGYFPSYNPQYTVYICIYKQENKDAIETLGNAYKKLMDFLLADSLIKIAPSNCLVRYIDQNGKVIATISNASERYAQRLVFRYDENGKLKYLLRFDENMEPTFHEGSDSVYLNFRLAIDSINFQCPDLRRHTLTEIIYGNDGIACGIIEQPSGKSIKAPDNYKLEVCVEQCLGFWESDLNGGCYILKTSIVPMSNLKEYSIKQFEDFSLVTESHYKDGILQSSYSNE